MIFQRVRLKALGRYGVVLCAMAMWTGAVQAHHSFALFDTSKLVAISGTVTKWDWINPHSWLYMDVARADGTTEKWAFECSSPNMMIRWGWNAKDVRIGDKITVDAHLARNGTHVASVKTLFLPGGKVLADPMGQGRFVSGDELATGLDSVPTKPRGEVYR